MSHFLENGSTLVFLTFRVIQQSFSKTWCWIKYLHNCLKFKTSDSYVTGHINRMLSLLHNFIQPSQNSGSAQVQILHFGRPKIRDGEDLWPWSRLEIRINVFRPSDIPQKQFNIMIIIHHHIWLKCHHHIWLTYSYHMIKFSSSVIKKS